MPGMFSDCSSLTSLVVWWEENVSPWFTVEKWSEMLNNIKTSFETKWGETAEQWKTNITNWWDNDVAPWFTKEKWVDAMSGIGKAFKETWEGAISSIKGIWNRFANWLNEKLTWAINPIVIAGQTIFDGATINLGRIPTFAAGGFPEDGWFRASHGEIMGRFDNGQSVVANNMQITEGISLVVQEGNRENNALIRQEIALLRQQNDILTGILNKQFGITNDDIGKAAKEYSDDYYNRTGNLIFSY